ncbi:MAG: Chloromuconate cycloisomerase [Verrucomicrobiales bacterium]|nr:Chloromuconate cycloisomerase [Verrucomicrobiales bacterium]
MSATRIASIETFVVNYATHGWFKFFQSPTGGAGDRPSVVIKMTTDTGVIGWGQSVPAHRWSYETLESVQTTIANYLTPVLIGLDPFDDDAIRAAMKGVVANSFSTGQPICKAGIDLALFDLTGKLLGQTAAQRWQRKGVESISLSWTLNPRSLDEIETQIAEATGRGYEHFNLKIAPNIKFDLEACQLIRKLVPKAFLWVDANGGYDEAAAMQVAPKLADLGIPVFEQPLPANRLTGYQRLKKQGALPILMDEGIVSHVELEEFIQLGCIDGIAIKVARGGGITEARRQIEIIENAGLIWLGSGLTDPDISLAASLLLYGAYGLKTAAALNGPQYLPNSILEKPFATSGGRIAVPTGIGLSVEIDEGKVKV